MCATAMIKAGEPTSVSSRSVRRGNAPRRPPMTRTRSVPSVCKSCSFANFCTPHNASRPKHHAARPAFILSAGIRRERAHALFHDEARPLVLLVTSHNSEVFEHPICCSKWSPAPTGGAATPSVAPRASTSTFRLRQRIHPRQRAAAAAVVRRASDPHDDPSDLFDRLPANTTPTSTPLFRHNFARRR